MGDRLLNRIWNWRELSPDLAAVNSLHSLTSREARMSWPAAAMTRFTFRLEQQISTAHRNGTHRPASLDWLLRRLAGTVAGMLGKLIPIVQDKAINS